jgi:phosphoribosylamine--glycine ligase
MKILVIGGGGREHALAWKLRQSPQTERIFCAPGNAGTADVGENIAIPANDLHALVRFAKENRVEFRLAAREKVSRRRDLPLCSTNVYLS